VTSAQELTVERAEQWRWVVSLQVTEYLILVTGNTQSRKRTIMLNCLMRSIQSVDLCNDRDTVVRCHRLCEYVKFESYFI
jgi:hypothetical protein